jgi:HK97 gp10 family phage protein
VAEVIEGLRELLEQFRALDRTMQRATLIKAARAGGEIVREAAERKAPRMTGNLAGSLKVRAVASESDIHQGTVDVFPGEFYGGFQERGTKHHKAQPFLAPAFDENEERISEAIAQVIAEAIDEVTED